MILLFSCLNGGWLVLFLLLDAFCGVRKSFAVFNRIDTQGKGINRDRGAGALMCQFDWNGRRLWATIER